MNTIGILLVILVIAIIVSEIDMSPGLKKIAWLIIGIAVIFNLLPLIGISVPTLK